MGCSWSCHLVCTRGREIALEPVQARQLPLGASSPLIHQLFSEGCGWKGWWWCCNWEVECEIYSEIQHFWGTHVWDVCGKYRLLAKNNFSRVGGFIMHPSEENVEFTKANKKVLSWVVEAWAVVMIWRSWCKFCKLDCEQISWEGRAEFDSNRPCCWHVFLPLKCKQTEGNFCCLVHIRLL